MNTQITAQDLVPLLPIILTSASAVIVMLLIAIKRNHALICASSIAGLAIVVVAAFAVVPESPQQISPLLIIDSYSLFFTIVILMLAACIAVFSFNYLYNLDDDVEEFYLLLLLATLGAVVMVSSNHFISAFLGLETLSISLYGMIAYPVHSKEAVKFPLEASVKYLVLSAVSSTFILFGIALLYAQTGTLSFSDLSAVLKESSP